MKTLYNAHDLAQYGVNTLTGEACAYSMRILCDLSDAGISLVCSFLGMPLHNPDDPTWPRFNQNWNTRVGADVARASIMLTPKSLRELMLFALCSDPEHDVVIDTDQSMVGLSEKDRYYYGWMEAAEDNNYRVYRLPHSRSGRNQHAFTGRTE